MRIRVGCAVWPTLILKICAYFVTAVEKRPPLHTEEPCEHALGYYWALVQKPATGCPSSRRPGATITVFC